MTTDIENLAAPSMGQLEQRRALRLGITGTVLGALALTAWAALAPLAAAVVAEGKAGSISPTSVTTTARSIIGTTTRTAPRAG